MCRHAALGQGLVMILVALNEWLDSMFLRALSNQNDDVILIYPGKKQGDRGIWNEGVQLSL